MADKVDPKQFALPPRTCLERESENHFVLVIDRKSRLIMADGRRIADQAEKIRTVRAGCKVSLKTTTAVCSKTRDFLAAAGIDLI